MKLDEGDRIVRVAICRSAGPGASDGDESEKRGSDNAHADIGDAADESKLETLDNVLLTTAAGRCIRFAVDDVRLFKGRDSSGVRGIRLDQGDEVISMAILRHVGATPGAREAYLKQALAMRRAQGAEVAEGAPEPDGEAEAAEGSVELTPERYAELGAHEQFVLTVSERGFGKRSSSTISDLGSWRRGITRQSSTVAAAGWWPPSLSRTATRSVLSPWQADPRPIDDCASPPPQHARRAHRKTGRKVLRQARAGDGNGATANGDGAAEQRDRGEPGVVGQPKTLRVCPPRTAGAGSLNGTPPRMPSRLKHESCSTSLV
jgi:hypothetical protein